MNNGYMGKILDIDLNSRKIETIDFPEDVKKQYLGGSGLAAWYLNKETDPAAIDPLGPENTFVLLTGPVCGTPVYSSSRYEACAKAPLTGVWGEATYPVGYEYDAYGQRTHMYTYRSGTDWSNAAWPEAAIGDATIWHYDEATGLLTAKEDAAGKKVTYSYTETGRLETRTWARPAGTDSLSTTYTYDPSTAELTEINYSDTTTDINFTYDRLGRQQSITDATGSRTFGYTDSLQLATETITGLYDKIITRNYEESGVVGRCGGRRRRGRRSRRPRLLPCPL